MYRGILAARLLGVIGVTAVMVLSFQNCTQNVTMSSSSQQAPALNQSGNGGTYDGKPDEGTYVRQNSLGCTGAKDPALIGVLQVSSVQSLITTDICKDMAYSIDFEDSRLDFSRYNRDYIGFNSAVFESTRIYASAPAPVELWCRHLQPDSGLDLVVKSGGQGYLYRGDNLASTKPSIYPRQSLAVQSAVVGQVLAVNSTSIQGTVDLSSGNNGIFAGQMNYAGSSLSVECRILSRDPAVYVAPSNIVAAYQMNGLPGNLVSGTVFADSSQNSNLAALYNANGGGSALVADGRLAQGLHLDGVDDYVDFSALAQAVGADFTVSLSLRPSLAIADDRVAFAVNTASAANVIKIGTGMCTGSADRTRLSLELGNNCYDTGVVIVDGSWHVVTASVTGGRIILYLDGAEVANQSLTLPFSVTDLWSLGADYDPGKVPGDFWLGDIDEVIVWSLALSAPP